MRQKFILWFVILAVALPVAAQQTPPTVIAPVTVVAPAEPLTADPNEPIRVVQSGPVTFTLPLGVWIAWLVSISTALVSVAVISRYATKAATFIHEASKYRSVIMEIAAEFKSDSGSTLKDAIDRIEAAAKAAQTGADIAKEMASKLENTLREHMALTKAREEVRMDTQRHET